MTGFDDLLARVTAALASRAVEQRIIGAIALAAHGVSRSTADVDLLVADPAVLDPTWWTPIAAPGFEVEVRRGDADDPLLGVVRFDEDVGEPVDWERVPESLDLVVPRGRWVPEMTRSAGPEVQLGSTRLRAVTAPDLVLLKLYAGGWADQSDIQRLLAAVPDLGEVVAEVDRRIGALPIASRRLWRRIRSH